MHMHQATVGVFIVIQSASYPLAILVCSQESKILEARSQEW